MSQAIGRFVSAAILTAAVLALAGCNTDYLYPGSSFERDEAWKQEWAARDDATRDMPLYLQKGPTSTGEDWNNLFPDADK